MNSKWLIDTNVVVDYLRGRHDAVVFIEQAIQATCYLSSITVAELFAGVRESKERRVLEQFLEIFEIVAVDHESAKKGGLYRRDYGKSHGVGLADAIIAASAEQCAAKLVTLNKKHFPMVSEVVVPYL